MESHSEEEIPYHALFCEILSSLLGVKCCAHLVIALLRNTVVGDILVHELFDLRFDEVGASSLGEDSGFLLDEVDKLLEAILGDEPEI